MKIAIIGTHSTGKTTLAYKLADVLQAHGYSVSFLNELSRMCPYPVNEQTTFEAQKWIQANQIIEEQKFQKPGTILICDRSTLDNFAYMQRQAERCNIDTALHKDNAIAHMDSYELVFKTTMLEIPAVNDGFRSVDDSFREEIDRRISHLLSTNSISHHLLPETDNYNIHIQHIIRAIQSTHSTAKLFPIHACPSNK